MLRILNLKWFSLDCLLLADTFLPNLIGRVDDTGGDSSSLVIAAVRVTMCQEMGKIPSSAILNLCCRFRARAKNSSVVLLRRLCHLPLLTLGY